MALVSLLFKQKVRLGVNASAEVLPFGAIELDASISENHTTSNEVTKFPVEEGVDITDHVRKKPDEVSIRGIVTDHPIGLGGALGRSGRSLDAYGQALFMLSNAQLVTVVTSLNTYEDMVIESMDVPRNNQRGHAVEMNLRLRQVMTVQVSAAAGPSNLGTQPTQPVN